MRVYFKSLRWNKSNIELVQGIKNNSVPGNAVRGSNGSFVCKTPSEMLLTLTTEEGRDITYNIIDLVKKANGWSRITDKRFGLVHNALWQEYEFEMSNGYVCRLAEYLKV